MSKEISEVVVENFPEDTATAKTNNASLKKETSKHKPPKPFPNHTIEESTQIAFSLKEYNAGNPWSPSDIANVLGGSHKSNSFFYLSAASRAYGFTTGTRDAKIIELTALGRKYIYATSLEEEYDCIYEAFTNIKILNEVYEYYKGDNLPDKKYLSNTLESNFNLDPQFHDEFIQLYTDNLAFLNKHSKNIETRNFPDVFTPNASKEEKNLNRKRELFVIMPFSEKTDLYPKGFFAEMFSSLIVPAASEANYIAKTANKAGSDIIQSTIVNQIISADLILADLTEHNPNVLFELGLAIAFEKKVVLIRAKGTKPIFDVDNLLRVFDYDSNLWKSTIERDVPNLTDHILATETNNGKSYLELLKKNA